MKLIGKLKENVAKAENKEQAREAIKQAGMELNDEELDQVSGGYGETQKEKCPYCNTFHNIVKEYPCFIKFRGQNYSNATQYTCTLNGNRRFYKVKMDNGEEVYIDDRMTHPRKVTSI